MDEDDLNGVAVLIDASFAALSKRMILLERKLIGEDRLIFSVRPSDLTAGLRSCAGVKDVRVQIRDPHLDVENKCLVATDGHKLIRIPVEVSPADTSGPVPLDAIKDARKRKLESAEIVCNGDATLIDSSSGQIASLVGVDSNIRIGRASPGQQAFP